MAKKILVCLDGSRVAEAILPYAAEEALHGGSKIILLQVLTGAGFVVTPAVPGVPAAPIPTRASAEQIEKEERAAEAYLESVARLLRQKGIDVEWTILPGPLVGQAIVDYARKNGVDLIAMATHGRGGLSRAVLGSIADYVLRESGIPLFIIRPRKAEQ